MENQRFFLKIDAESPDGEAIKCETQVKINCEKKVTAAILVNLMKENEELKLMFMDAFLLLMTTDDDPMSETISDEEFNKRLKKQDEDNLDF